MSIDKRYPVVIIPTVETYVCRAVYINKGCKGRAVRRIHGYPICSLACYKSLRDYNKQLQKIWNLSDRPR